MLHSQGSISPPAPMRWKTRIGRFFGGGQAPMRWKSSHQAILRRRADAHAMKIIASGDSSAADRRPCDENHRIGRSFAAGPAPMRWKSSHQVSLRRRAGAHAMKIIASGDPSAADRRPCDENHRIGRSFGAGPAPMR